MKSLVLYIKESILPEVFEGGNAVTANPIPAYITPLIYKDIEDAIKKYDSKIKIVPLGSVGKKKDDDFNGDIDVAISITNREELLKMIDEIWPNYEVNKFVTPVIVSMSYPYNKEGQKGNAQVDFMMTKSIDWAKWRFSSPDIKNGESKYKAAPKVYILMYAISSIPVKDAKDEYFEDGKTVKKHWRYAFNAEGVFLQLEDYTGKKGPLKNPKKIKEMERLITNDPINVMRFIFGDKYDEKDFRSAEALWKAIHSDKWPWGDEALYNFEKRWVEEYINGKGMKECKVDPNDFPCTQYKINGED